MSEPGHWFESDPNWFKHAVFYEIHTRAFFDGNDDGSGDLRGVVDKLDYLQWLGIDCIWLLPLYPSPLRTAATTSPTSGTCTPTTARSRTSTRWSRRAPAWPARDRRPRHEPHLVRAPWFQAARSDPEGPYGDWYVWWTPTTAGPRRGSSSSTPSRRTGRGIRCAASTSGTASSRTSRT